MRLKPRSKPSGFEAWAQYPLTLVAPEGSTCQAQPVSKHILCHAAVMVVLTPEAKISRYLYGLRFEPRDVRLSLVEAAGGKVGTSFDLMPGVYNGPRTIRRQPIAGKRIRCQVDNAHQQRAMKR